MNESNTLKVGDIIATTHPHFVSKGITQVRVADINPEYIVLEGSNQNTFDVLRLNATADSYDVVMHFKNLPIDSTVYGEAE